MTAHASRPAAVFYTLNRRYRVVHLRRFNVYAVQHRQRPGWREMLNSWYKDAGTSIDVCARLGQPCRFVQGEGWV